ncbi:hypothetical protein B4U79_02755 [Dinothrombium tinctorium]|uniref:Uncharacterized protein n=1 Tax=Dinothrombium tinctorium TaxID=1965070 RepID=A0A3S3PWU1_9ACAR|nr:hypothetical protein B4U79_02664 [Dinothrombium tinctorium]RWS09625.1 hypothetical protein B4U79_02755 [Dinothrombium tinctorium]
MKPAPLLAAPLMVIQSRWSLGFKGMAYS